MQITIYVISTLVGILGLLSAACFSVGHRDAGLWATCAAVVLAVIGGFAWYQAFLWERDASVKKSDAMVKHARIVRVNTRLIVPESEKEGVRLAFGLINTGDADATVTLWDQTYFFSVDPTRKVFLYMPTDPVEIPVSAIPNAVWNAELRFDFKMTKEKEEALRSGKAQLFFYARGESRDATGKAVPLPFAEMYDATFTGNLVAPPDDVVFK